MTAKSEDTNEEPGRPAWAAGLDLSPELTRAEDVVLTDIIRWPSKEDLSIARRLADAEMRVAALEKNRTKSNLQLWAENNRLAGNVVELQSRNRSLEDQLQPLTEALRDALAESQRGEPDFLIDQEEDLWFRVETDRYGAYSGDLGVPRARIERLYGPVTEAWK